MGERSRTDPAPTGGQAIHRYHLPCWCREVHRAAQLLAAWRGGSADHRRRGTFCSECGHSRRPAVGRGVRGTVNRRVSENYSRERLGIRLPVDDYTPRLCRMNARDSSRQPVADGQDSSSAISTRLSADGATGGRTPSCAIAASRCRRGRWWSSPAGIQNTRELADFAAAKLSAI